VAKTNTFIELNGKRYNAHTGELIAGQNSVATAIKSHTKSTAPRAAKTMDGVVRVSKQLATSPVSHKKVAPTPTNPVKKTVTISDVRRVGAQHVKHRKTAPSTTLMRRAVKKPSQSLKRTVKAHAPRTDVLAKVPKYEMAAKLSVRHVDSRRLQRAERIAKNKMVSRFGHIEVSKPVHHTTSSPANHIKAAMPSIQSVSTATDIHNIKPVFADSSSVTANLRQPSLDVFEQALARANSHKETYISPKHAKKQAKKASRSFSKKLASTGATALALLLLVGFIAYQNQANLVMRVAASKAGFSATMPGYKPAGFSTGKFQYSPGIVAVQFKSNTDDRVFNITQKVSNWNSETLLNEFVSNAKGHTYNALEAGGRTIYTYGNNNATWVDKGVWYNVESNGNLSTSQLVDLATSM
jgi:hypothetical protein